ncbi:unnamed protein product [Amoebophrya sp. A120]|nr:unnamed protein product [Amoebophrya sp. A120]|eukprot:GSA120T00020070001.1
MTTSSEQLGTFTGLYDLGPQNFYYAACADGLAWFQSRGLDHLERARQDDEVSETAPKLDLVCCDIVQPMNAASAASLTTGGTPGFPRKLLYGLRTAHCPPLWTREGLVVAADHFLWLFHGFEEEPLRISFPGFEIPSADTGILSCDSLGRIAIVLRRKITTASSTTGGSGSSCVKTSSSTSSRNCLPPATHTATDVLVVLDPRPLTAAAFAPEQQMLSTSGGPDLFALLGRYYPVSVEDQAGGGPSAQESALVLRKKKTQLSLDLNFSLHLPETQCLFTFELAPHERVDCVDLVCPPGPDASKEQKQALSASNAMFNWRLLACVREPNTMQGRLMLFENANAAGYVEGPDGSLVGSQAGASPKRAPPPADVRDVRAGGRLDAIRAALLELGICAAADQLEPTCIRDNWDLFGSVSAAEAADQSQHNTSAATSQIKRCMHWCDYAKPQAKWLGGGRIAVLMTVDDRCGMYTVAVFPLFFHEVKWRSHGSHLRRDDPLNCCWTDFQQPNLAPTGDASSAAASLSTSSTNRSAPHLLFPGCSQARYERTLQLRQSSTPNPWNRNYKTAVPECFGEFDGNSFVVFQDVKGTWHGILSRPGSAGKPPKNAEAALCPDDARFWDELWTLNFDRGLCIRLPGPQVLTRGCLVPLFAEPAAADTAPVSPSPKRGASSTAASVEGTPVQHTTGSGTVGGRPGVFQGGPRGTGLDTGTAATSLEVTSAGRTPTNSATKSGTTTLGSPTGGSSRNAGQAGAIYVFHASPTESGDVFYVCNGLNPEAVNYVPTYRLTYTGRRFPTAPPRCLSIPAPSRGGERVPCVVYLPETCEYVKDGPAASSSPERGGATRSSSSSSSSSSRLQRKYPVIVWLHGGPNSHTRLDWIPTSPNALGSASPNRTWGPVHLGPWLASHGYICVMPNFVGGTRYGLSRLRAGWGPGRFGVADVSDVLDVGKYFRTRQAQVDFFGDKGASEQGFAPKIGLAGRSCGGLVTLLCVQQAEAVSLGNYTGGGSEVKMAVKNGGFQAFPTVFQCGVAFCPITDWARSQQCSNDSRDVSLLGGFVTDPVCPNPALEHARRISPVFVQGPLQAPVLVMHGTEDQVVTFDNCLRFRDLVLKKHCGGYEMKHFDAKTESFVDVERVAPDFEGGSSPDRSRAAFSTSGAVKNGVTATNEEPATLITVQGEDHTLVRQAGWRREIPLLLLHFFSRHLQPWEYPNNCAPWNR